ncbi:MAG: N-acetylneuraminate synthase family protein [Spirochaetaceae bacterium]|nr:N-acetylneuraminate synthase family protein [Spirochaetaceae bacterium]
MQNLVHISAEIGTSHGGSLEKAYQLIDVAVDAGADSVKFQWVYAHEILHPNTGLVQLPGGAIPLYERFQQLEVPASFFQQVRDYARSKGCQFICSPFGLKSLEELAALSPDAIKIASPELNHHPLLQRLAEIRQEQRLQGRTPVPVIISSGVSTLADIEQALEILSNYGEGNTQGITLLHCVTSYPAPEEEYNLQVLQNLEGIFGVEVGVSDHSLDPHLVPVLATACGAHFIEKHITLSRQTEGLDDPVALEPAQFASMVQRVRQWETPIKNYGCQCGASIIMEELEEEYGKDRVQSVLGTGIKKLAPAERANYGRTNRSIHVLNDMKVGDIITQDSIAILRTEKILEPGLAPKYFSQIIGARLSKDIVAGQGVLWHHIMNVGTHC